MEIRDDYFMGEFVRRVLVLNATERAALQNALRTLSDMETQFRKLLDDETDGHEFALWLSNAATDIENLLEADLEL